MRQGPDGAWVGVREGPSGDPRQAGRPESRIEIADWTREGCLRALEASVRSEPGTEPVTMVIEVVPALAGVAEAAQMLGWDKRRVVTYAARGRFPRPVQALASGRVWLRDDVEAFAADFRDRSLRRAGAGAAGPHRG